VKHQYCTLEINGIFLRVAEFPKEKLPIGVGFRFNYSKLVAFKLLLFCGDKFLSVIRMLLLLAMFYQGSLSCCPQ